MEQPQSLPGTDGIRSLTDEDAIFGAFDAYPWKKDPAFMSGLQAILGDPKAGTPLETLRDMAAHARIFYYSQRIGTAIDFARYQAWHSQQTSGEGPPDIIPKEYREAAVPASSPPPLLPWQQAAPKAELFVDKTAAAQPSSGGEPNYPMAFAEMLKLLQEGKPIPGIRQIPNTVARDPSVKPVGTRIAPKKPWEKDTSVTESASVSAPQHGQTLDLEFPPVDGAGDTTVGS
jgi:hypothetical protein